MIEKNLFLICPECNIEFALRKRFGQDICLLTALGSVFNFSTYEYSEALDDLINRETVVNIVVVNSTECRFTENIILKNNGHNTHAEQQLARIYNNHKEDFTGLSTYEQLTLLSKLNIYRQLYELFEVAFIGEKIDNGLLKASGLIYNHKDMMFQKVNLIK